jgi:hypothetical protein
LEYWKQDGVIILKMNLVKLKMVENGPHVAENERLS